MTAFRKGVTYLFIVGIALLIEGVQNLISRYAYKKTSEAYFVEFEKEQ